MHRMGFKMSLESNGLVLRMSGMSKCMLMFTAGALVSASAVAQVRPASPAPRPAVPGGQGRPAPAPKAAVPGAQTGQAATQPGAPVPGNPDYQVAQPAPDQLAPAPLPPAIW